MENLSEIQEKAAKEKGYNSWRELLSNQNSGFVSRTMEEIAERYRSNSLQEQKEELRQWLIDEDFEGLSERI